MANQKNRKIPKTTLPPLSNTKQETFENKKIVDWFAETSQSQESTQMLSRFGLKTPGDLRIFLRSPAGKALRGLINNKLAAMNAGKDSAASKQLQQQRLFMLLLGLAYKQEAAAEAAEARIIRLNDKLVQKQLDAGEKRIEAQEKALEESMESSSEAEALYHESAEALEETLEEHSDGFDNLDIEWNEIQDIERGQETRANFIESLIADIEKFFDLDAEEQEQLTHNDRKLINQFPKGKILVKEDGTSYLLERGQKLGQLSSQEKTAAHQEYLKLKPAINALQEKIQTSHQEDKTQHAERKARFFDKSVQRHQETIVLTQQLALIQAARQTVQHQQAPQQNIKTSPLPEAQPNTAVLTRSFKLMLKLDPRGVIAAQDRLGAPRLLQQTEFGMPLEQRTMESLQKHRAGRAGALANDLLTNPQALAAQRNEARLNPDAEPRPKTQAKSDLKAELQTGTKPTPEPKAEPAQRDTPSPLSTRPKPR